VRESTLPTGTTPSASRVAASRWAMVIAAFTLLNAAWFGLRWWEAEAGSYRNNRLFRPREASAHMDTNTDPAILTLTLSEEQFRRSGPLVPDHGKLIHLFLIREPSMDVFAHLHPTKRDWRTFRGPLPALPPGSYRIYGDLTYETGFSETVTNQIEIAPSISSRARTTALPEDDAWWVDPAASTDKVGADNIALPEIAIDLVSSEVWRANQDVQLQFRVRATAGQSLLLEPYMGMLSHLILRNQAGTVFTHLHPNGSFSMAAQSAEGKAPLKVADPTADPLCQLPAPPIAAPSDAAETTFSFPYAFPQSGVYRLWLQCRSRGVIITRSFQVKVESSSK
jgi:hypothetical protein